MRRTFSIHEDLFYLAIVAIAAAVVALAVTNGDAYPLVSSSSVVTTAEDCGTVERTLEIAPAPNAVAVGTPKTPTVPMTATGDAAAH